MDQDRLAAAATFAVERHVRQRRKGSEVPYLVHPIAAAETLAYFYGDREDLVVAGFLHDVVEDRRATSAEIEARFGAEVARLVAGVTKSPGGSWLEAASTAIAKMRADPDVARLKAADAFHNAGAMARDLRYDDGTFWARFRAGPDEISAYYRGIALAARQTLADEPLAVALDELVGDVFGPGPALGTEAA